MLRKYLLSSAARLPEGVEGAVAEQPELALAADPPGPELDPEPEPDARPQQTAAEKALIGEITVLRQQNRATKSAAEEEIRKARQEAADARVLAERLARGEKLDPLPDPVPQPQNNDADVDRRADFKLFVRDVNEVRETGFASFPDFKDTITLLSDVVGIDNSFLADVIAVDKTNAHAILDKLAKDPQKALSLVQMDPRRRTAELTRLSMAATKPAPAPAVPIVPAAKPGAKAVSKAPPPAPVVEASASKIIDGYADDSSEEDFTRQFYERAEKRAKKDWLVGRRPG